MTTTTDLAERVEQGAPVQAKTGLPALVEQMGPQFARALPTHIPAERFTRLALTVLRQKDQQGRLVFRNVSPESFLGALMTCAQLGLEPNTPAGEAYLIPYGNVATFVPGYRGLAKLAWNSGAVSEMYAELVHEKDHFVFRKGLHRDLVHEPHLGDDAGAVVGAYAVVKMKDGGVAFDYWSIEQIRKHESAHSKARSGKAPADLAGWMQRKTVLKQVLKLVPSSPSLTQALTNDGAVRTDLSFAAIDVIDGDAEPDDEPVDAEVVDEGAAS